MSDRAATGPGRSLRVGLTQLTPTPDTDANLAQAVELIGEVGRAGADLILLPENCLACGTNAEMRANALREDSVSISALRDAAREVATPVVLGGFKRIAEDGATYNTALVLGSDGTTLGLYNKVHLFDAKVGGTTYSASSVETPGDRPVLLDLGGARIGLTICYDIRFPELFRALAGAGAEVLLIPAAFVTGTGEAHWEVLNRARAIENGAWVVSSTTVGDATAMATWGHAMVVDPWGAVVADLGDAGRAWEVVHLDLERVHEVRDSMPVLRGRRSAAYAAAVGVVRDDEHEPAMTRSRP